MTKYSNNNHTSKARIWIFIIFALTCQIYILCNLIKKQTIQYQAKWSSFIQENAESIQHLYDSKIDHWAWKIKQSPFIDQDGLNVFYLYTANPNLKFKSSNIRLEKSQFLYKNDDNNYLEPFYLVYGLNKSMFHHSTHLENSILRYLSTLVLDNPYSTINNNSCLNSKRDNITDTAIYLI